MPREIHVVQYNETTDLYMTEYNPDYNLCLWGSLALALQFPSLETAENIAASINSGTVGTTKPQP